MYSRREVIVSATAGVTTIGGCSLLETPGHLTVTIANQSSKGIVAELLLIRDEQAQLEVSQEISAGEDWESSELVTQEYFAVLFLRDRGETIRFHYIPGECSEGILTAIVTDDGAEFVKNKCGIN